MSLTLSAVCVCVYLFSLFFSKTDAFACVCGWWVFRICCPLLLLQPNWVFFFSFVFSTHNSPSPRESTGSRFAGTDPVPAGHSGACFQVCVWVCLIAKCVYNWFNCWRENASTTTTTDNRVCVMTTTDKSFFPSFAGLADRGGRDTDAVRDLQCPRSPSLDITPKTAPNTLERVRAGLLLLLGFSLPLSVDFLTTKQCCFFASFLCFFCFV